MNKPDRRPERISTPEELSYLAGIIDGEGYVGIARTTSGYYCAEVSVAMTNPSALILMQELFGGALTTRRTRNVKAKPHQRLRYVGRNAYRVLLKVKPYLRVKLKQADTVLQLETLQKQSRLERNPSDRSKKLPSYLEREKCLYDKCKELNGRGILAHQRDILQSLESLWVEQPYLRLGQLLCNASESTLFYVEDAELIEQVRKVVKELGR